MPDSFNRASICEFLLMDPRYQPAWMTEQQCHTRHYSSCTYQFPSLPTACIGSPSCFLPDGSPLPTGGDDGTTMPYSTLCIISLSIAVTPDNLYQASTGPLPVPFLLSCPTFDRIALHATVTPNPRLGALRVLPGYPIFIKISCNSLLQHESS